MRRFFKLIPEAVQLVLHAAALAKGGQMYVLEMSEPRMMVEWPGTSCGCWDSCRKRNGRFAPSAAAWRKAV